MEDELSLQHRRMVVVLMLDCDRQKLYLVIQSYIGKYISKKLELFRSFANYLQLFRAPKRPRFGTKQRFPRLRADGQARPIYTSNLGHG